MGASTAGLFDAASNNLAAAVSSSGSSSAASGSGTDEAIASAQYGFDGRVLSFERNEASQLFSALA